MVFTLGLTSTGGVSLDRGSEEAVRVKETGAAHICTDQVTNDPLWPNVASLKIIDVG